MSTAIVTHKDCILHDPGLNHPENQNRLISIFNTIKNNNKKEWKWINTNQLINVVVSFKLNVYKSIIKENDHVVFISDKGDISAILANGFVENLGKKNIYSLNS